MSYSKKVNYLSLTIGPIYKTLMGAKKTREIWGASYFFSYFMKMVIKRLIENGVRESDFITPYVEKEKLNSANGVGLFHDRLIFKSENLKEMDFQKLVAEVFSDIEKKSKGKITKKFLKNYLQIHIIEIDDKINKKIDNPILDISPYLDSAELMFQSQFESKNQLLTYIRDRLNSSFLAKDAFGQGKASFPSLPKIAMRSFVKDIDSDIDEQEFMAKLIKRYSNEIKPYNKYIAIIQADGDNMGAILKKIGGDNSKLKEFSKALFDFCIEANSLVEKFGGVMIYAGGDDLFFFASVAKDNKTIFHLLSEIDKLFMKKIDPIIENIKLDKKPSLSFGVSITYYKYPLQEAREEAGNLLFYNAKSGSKNQIAYRVIKHSGQYFESKIYKGDNLFSKFLDFIEINEDIDSNFLHSIYTKINIYRDILNQIAKDSNSLKDRLESFFNNNFNETIHKNYSDFFNSLIELMVEVYKSGENSKSSSLESVDDKTNFIYSALRFKKFLIGDK